MERIVAEEEEEMEEEEEDEEEMEEVRPQSPAVGVLVSIPVVHGIAM